MSFINLDDDQRWVPTHVQVTVLRGRGLRAKGKHGTSDVYTVIQVGKEKFTTAVVEKTTAPEWTEECAFELLPGVLEEGGLSAYPPGSSDLVLTVMHRALIGPDVFLGHVVLPLDKVFQDKICLRNEWYKLRSKSGRKEKERGELQITVQFTRNNLTASMFDLSVKDKPRSAFGKLKDRMTGKKWGDSESASAIVPGGYAVLSGGGRRLSGEDGKEEEEGKRSKVKSFFLKGKLRRSSDAQSSTSLASECSMTSSPGGSLSPTAGINMLVSDLSNSPSENSNHPTDSSPVHPVQPPPKVMTHKRAFSDEASRVTVALPRPRAVETLRAQSGVLSRSTLCINGSHVYGGEPSTSTSTLPPTLGLLQKCAPLSRSLQNLARRADDPRRSPSTARRWSFDRSGKEEKMTPAADAPSGQPLLAASPSASTAVTGADPSSDSKKQKRNLFSQGRSESAGKGPDTSKGEQGQALPPSEERYKGWFSAKDSHSKPSQEVSPMVETSTDVHCHPSPRSPNHLPPCSSPASASPGSVHHANPFTPSPATPPISPSNPFFTRLQCNPFYEELLADQAQKTASPTPPCLSRSPPWPSAPSPSWPGSPSPALHTVPQGKFIPRRERPVGVSRQRSLPALLTGQSNSSPNPFSTRSMSESGCEWDESFEAFATSRLKSPRGPAHRMNSSPKEWSVGGIAEEMLPNDVSVTSGRAPPLPPRRPVRTPVKEGRRDSWLDRAQELAVKKEACLLSQTDAASMLHRRVGDSRRNAPCSSQLPPSDREAEGVQTAKPLMTPSDLSSRQAHERPRMRLPEKSASLENYGSLRMSGGDGSLVWGHRLEQGPASRVPEPIPDSNQDSAPEFFSLDMSEELSGDTTSNFFGIFGEVEDKVPSLLSEMHNNNTRFSAEPYSTATLPADRLCTANQDVSDISAANVPEPLANVATVHPSNNGSKPMDLNIITKVPNKNIDGSRLTNNDSVCSPCTRVDNIFEINNNTEKDFSLSPTAPGLFPDEVYPNKCHSSITGTFSNSPTVASLDCGNEGGCMPIAPGPVVGLTFGTSRNAAETYDLESDFSVSTKPLEDVLGQPGTLAEGNISGLSFASVSGVHTENTNFANVRKGNANTGKVFGDCFQTEWSPREQKMNSEPPCKVLATEMGSDDIRQLPSIAFNMPCSDSRLGDTCQVSLKEEDHGKSNLKTSPKASTNHFICGSSLTAGCPETNQPKTVTEGVALNCHTPDEDGTIVETTVTEQVDNSVQSNTGDVAVHSDSMEKGDSLVTNTGCLFDPALSQERGCSNQEVCDPPPKPPRLFNESMPTDHQMSEGSIASQEASLCRMGGCTEPGALNCPFSEGTRKMSFEDLHAKVAPSLRSRSGIDGTSPGLTLHGSAPRASSAPSPVAKTNAPSALFPLPTPIPPTVRQPAETVRAAVPSSTASPAIGSARTVLPKETRPATSSLSRQESSPHLVKPLTSSAPQGEKKMEGRSVLVSGLEKLKSTIHPGRASQPGESEAEREKLLSESAAQYSHLTNNEIIALLLQREAELEKQGAEFERQEALLEKREVELKKMKVQVRDLEDYIDRLLVRIMEQTPTLLQVRSRYK